jgi:hypothetical protein
MEALKTIYNGVKYRSKLEARWAKFFDLYGLRFEYEPTTFQLKHGLYCPDFYLPDLACYAEVKPLIPLAQFLDEYQEHDFFGNTVWLKPKEYRKIQEFEDAIVLLCGLPLERNFILFNVVDLDCWQGFNCYPIKDPLTGWRWWSCTKIDDYPNHGNIQEAANLSRYYDFFNY